MPAQSTGSVYQRGDGVWCCRIRTKDGRRVSVELPEAVDLESAKLEAVETRRVLREAEEGKPAPKPAGETVETWVARWFADRKRRGLSSVEADEPRWKKWIAPHLNALSMTAVEKPQIEALVEKLDRAIVDGDLGWKTATNAWGLLCKAFDDACASKTLALRVRTDNPTAGVRGPERGGKPSKPVLAPKELLRLLRCAGVNRDMRRAFAVAVYSGLRSGELRALRWPDVDFETMTILVHEQIDRKTKVRRETKTKLTRRVPIELHLAPLLRVMHEEAGGHGAVLRFRFPKHTPRLFRAALVKAGVVREELHVRKDRTRTAFRAHDTRGSYATWCAARGDSVLRIAACAGHTTLTTTQGYVAAAEMLRDSLRDVFPVLPPELLGPVASVDGTGHGTDMEPPKSAESLWVGRDSNPGENVGDPGGSPDDWTPPAQAEIQTPPDASGTPPPGGRVEDVRRVLDGLLRLIGEAVRVLDGGDVEGALRLVSAPR